MQNNFKTFICLLKHVKQLDEFSLAELKSLLVMKGINLKTIFSQEISSEDYPENPYDLRPHFFKNYPLIKLYHDSEQQLQEIAKRSNAIQYIYEHIEFGKTYEDLLDRLEPKINEYSHYFLNPENNFAFESRIINKNYTYDKSAEVCDMIKKRYPQFIGKVKLIDEDFKFIATELHRTHEEKNENEAKKKYRDRMIAFLKRQSDPEYLTKEQQLQKNKNEKVTPDQLQKYMEHDKQKLENKKEKFQKQYEEKKLRKQERIEKEQKEFGSVDVQKEIEKITQEIEEYDRTSMQMVSFGVCRIKNKNRRVKHQRQVFNTKFQLQDRAYLGPTSAEHQLAFFMANQAMVEEGDLVLDPFVGTAGLLIPPAYFKAVCFGTDIDSRVIHGSGVGRLNTNAQYVKDNLERLQSYAPKIMINFEQYGLNTPEILRMDCLTTGFRSHQLFDAIIADPPYGIRATSRKTGRDTEKKMTNKFELKQDVYQFDYEKQNPGQKWSDIGKKEQRAFIRERYAEDKQKQGESNNENEEQKQEENDAEEQKNNDDDDNNNETNDKDGTQLEKNEPKQIQCYAPTQQVDVKQQVQGLVDLAYNVLRPGGRLVFLFPVSKDIYNAQGIKALPQDPRFELREYSNNAMIGPYVRILVTMIKL